MYECEPAYPVALCFPISNATSYPYSLPFPGNLLTRDESGSIYVVIAEAPYSAYEILQIETNGTFLSNKENLVQSLPSNYSVPTSIVWNSNTNALVAVGVNGFTSNGTGIGDVFVLPNGATNWIDTQINIPAVTTINSGGYPEYIVPHTAVDSEGNIYVFFNFVPYT